MSEPIKVISHNYFYCTGWCSLATSTLLNTSTSDYNPTRQAGLLDSRVALSFPYHTWPCVLLVLPPLRHSCPFGSLPSSNSELCCRLDVWCADGMKLRLYILVFYVWHGKCGVFEFAKPIGNCQRILQSRRKTAWYILIHISCWEIFPEENR